jgi:hypothetical protein
LKAVLSLHLVDAFVGPLRLRKVQVEDLRNCGVVRCEARELFTSEQQPVPGHRQQGARLGKFDHPGRRLDRD